MELTGRLTKDAVIKTLPDERQVINFTIAINDYYKPKGAAEGKEYTLFVSCSYWRNTGIAAKLSKGSVAEVAGRLEVQAYAGADGEAKASVNFHCNRIKVHHSTGKNSSTNEVQSHSEAVANNAAAATPIAGTDDDIPF